MNAFDLRADFTAFTLAACAEWEAPCAALFGQSGSGKSTVLEALAGVRAAVRGRVVLRGQRLDDLPARARGVGWVPQEAALLPHLTAGGNVAFAARLRGSAAAMQQAIAALELEDLLDVPAPQLSGGERQRVAIARALASQPRFLLLDEPLASVDRPLRARIVPFLRRIVDELHVPMLVVTHDPAEVLALATHVLVLEQGRIAAAGDPHSVFPSSQAFASLAALGAENVFAVAAADLDEDDVLRVRTARGCTLFLATVPGFPQPRRVAVRAEDVMLSIERPAGVSAQNVLPARVVRIEAVGRQAFAHLLAGGEPWQAKVTHRAVDALRLAPGGDVFLLVKAHAVLPSP